MVYSIQKLPDEPIIIDTHGEPMEVANYPNFVKELVVAVTSIEGPIYRITDLSDMSFSFPTLVLVLAEETRAGVPGTAGDPRVNLNLVAQGEIAELIQASVIQKQYGARQMMFFSTVDDALCYVREQISRNL
jgi:hypothetical protein